MNKPLGIALAVLVVAGGIYAGIELWPASVPDVETASDQELAEFAATPAFKELSAEKQRAMMQRLWEARRDPERREQLPELTDEQRQQIRQNMRDSFMRRAEEQAQRYIDAPTEAEKTAILDETIDQMQEHRAEWEKRRAEREQQRTESSTPEASGEPPAPPADRPEGGGRPGPSLDRVKQHVEHVSPEVRAYHQALWERMAERGIEFHRGPGRPH